MWLLIGGGGGGQLLLNIIQCIYQLVHHKIHGVIDISYG